MFEQCSLLLLNYARPECMERILAENVHLPWGDILIMDSWHLAGDDYPFQWPTDPRIRCIGMDELLGQYPRACGSMLTKSHFVCTQDDDYLVTAAGWERLFQEWDNEHIVRLVPEWCPEPQSIKLGCGSMFDNRWLQASWAKYLAMDPLVGEEQSREAADEAWTTFWGLQKPITGWQKYVTFLLDRNWMRAETNDKAMSRSMKTLLRRAEVRGCAQALRQSFCSSQCQTEKEFPTVLQKLVKDCFG